jgi:hypothetical protein
MAAISEVKAELLAYAERMKMNFALPNRPQADNADGKQAASILTEDMPLAPALQVLVDRFQLSSFEGR